MLQIEHGEFLRGVLIVLCRQIDISVAHLLRYVRPVVDLVDRALRNILHRVELLVGGRNINAATPTARTIVVQAAWIGHRRTVDVQLIVVEALVLRLRRTRPHAVLVLGHLIDLASNVKSHECSLRSHDLRTNHALGVHCGELLVLLIRRSRFEVLNDVCRHRRHHGILSGRTELGPSRQARKSRQRKKKSFHKVWLLKMLIISLLIMLVIPMLIMFVIPMPIQVSSFFILTPPPAKSQTSPHIC